MPGTVMLNPMPTPGWNRTGMSSLSSPELSTPKDGPAEISRNDVRNEARAARVFPFTGSVSYEILPSICS